MPISSRSRVNIVFLFILVFSMNFALFDSVKAKAQTTASTAMHAVQIDSQSNWPTFGYDLQHTHYNPNETVLNVTNVHSLMLGWQAATSGMIERLSSPIIANGIAYIGDDTDTLYAYNATTGALLWSYAVGNDHFWPSVTVVSSIAYVADQASHLAALNATTGSVVWTTTMPGGGGGTNSSPAVVNNVVYIGLNNVPSSLAAFNAGTGALLWNQILSNTVSGSPAIINGVVYVATINNGSVYALDAQTGSILWSGAISSGANSGVTVSNGIVYVNAFTQSPASTNLYAFNASGCGGITCSPLWGVPDGTPSVNLIPAPAVANGVVYVGSSLNNAAILYAFDANTGATLWTWTDSTTGTGINSSAAVANGVVYDATIDGNVYAFNASGCGGVTCSPLWTSNLGNGIGTQSSPAVVNGMVYIGAYNTVSPNNGLLFAFSLPTTPPFNSAVNNLNTDATTDQSETTVAVSSVNSPGLTVMVAFNDLTSENTGYSYSFDGGTRWTDGGAPPVYHDRSGNGTNGGDPALTVDKNGIFYLAQIEYTANLNEFIGMSKCNYVPSTGKITCKSPVKASNPIPICHPTSGGVLAPNDKPGITYDPMNNRVYITWTLFTFDKTGKCGVTSTKEKLRYFNVSTGQFSATYTLGSLSGNGTDPVVTNSGLVYVFFLQTTAQGLGQSIVYFTFNNGTIASHTLATINPAAQLDSSCGPKQEAFVNQAFDSNHAARTNELPAATVDSSGNIDVVWEAAPPNGGGAGYSVIWFATLPNGGGTPYIQVLPDKQDSTGTLLIQWQPAIAFAGGTNALAVTYFQVIQLNDGSYQIERDQVNATASSQPSFGTAFPISTVSWNALPTIDMSNNTPCYEGDYSASVSTPTANVVWSYWGDNRNGSQADVYGLFANVP